MPSTATPPSEAEGAGPEAMTDEQHHAHEAGRMNWRPIESAPKDGSNVLIIAASAYSPEARVGWWNDGWCFYSRPDRFWAAGVTGMVEATHWMPLPPPPESGASVRAMEREDGQLRDDPQAVRP